MAFALGQPGCLTSREGRARGQDLEVNGILRELLSEDLREEAAEEGESRTLGASGSISRSTPPPILEPP